MASPGAPRARPAAAQDPAATPDAAGLLAALPGGPDARVQYVGTLEGGEVYVAVVDRGASFVDVYLCDGADLAVWLEGSGDATTGAFAAANGDGVRVEGTLADGVASGTATLADGTARKFTAPEAVLPAGLYAQVAVEEGQGVLARTIVLPDNTARGVKTAYNCKAAQADFYIFQEAYLESESGSPDAFLFGNAMTQKYREARAAGCNMTDW